MGGVVEPDRYKLKTKPDAGGHAVLLVGYGECDTAQTTPECIPREGGPVKKGQKYWKMKNSWGAGWANDGYFYFVRGATDYFGPQGVCGMLGAAGLPMAPDLDGVVLL